MAYRATIVYQKALRRPCTRPRELGLEAGRENMAARKKCEWNKFKEQMKAKRTKKEPNAKVAPGMASILERGEITGQQLNAAVSGKAQKYERVAARQFVPLTISRRPV